MTKFARPSLALALPLTLMANAFAAELEIAEAPEIQVEVIIFAQQDVYGSEGYPQQPELRFPIPNRYLTDPEQEIAEEITQPDCPQPAGNHFEQFDAEGQTALEPGQPTTEIPEDNELATVSEELASEAFLEPEPVVEAEVFEPEPSFVMLDKNTRLLGREAYTLNRSGGFKVLYHQAWRQPKLSAKASPWVVVQAVEATAGRFELEGSIRVYQSRHPHVQAKLWQTRLLDTSQFIPVQLEDKPEWMATLQLPIFPEKQELQKEQPQQELLPCPSIEPQEEGSLVLDVEAELQTSGTELELPESTESLAEIEPIIETSYQVLDLQQLSQSARLHYSEKVYLDHPHLGVLVMISEYEPPELDSDTSEDSAAE